jgi:hypothetical protein
MILIVTQRLDPHVDRVEPLLDERGLPWVRLHLSDLPAHVGASIVLSSEPTTSGTLMSRRGPVPLADITAVWYRRTEQPDPGPFDDEETGLFAQAECRALIRALWTGLSHAFWVSSPTAIQGASNKLEQLLRARGQGFRVPRSCFSNVPEDILGFVAAEGGPENVVYKPSTSLIVTHADGTSGVAYTTTLSDELLGRLGEIRRAPGIFQQRVRKRRDIRVTVFGDRAFSVAIESQEGRETVDDFRAAAWGGPPLPHVALPGFELEAQCVELVRSYGLAYGAIDIVEAVDGSYWFLEINPNGQWAWQENLARVPMAEALVDMLQRRKT